MCVSLNRQNPHLAFKTLPQYVDFIIMISFKDLQEKLQSREKACKRFVHHTVPYLPAV